FGFHSRKQSKEHQRKEEAKQQPLLTGVRCPGVVATIARVAQVLPYKSPWNLAPISLLFLSRMTCLPIAEETAQAAAGHSPFQFLFEFLDPSFHLSFRLLCCFKLTFQHLLLPGELVYLCN
uniref:Uncharacterized protein n=1 Tax=Podarcis muralis TaxID=64176 RepID=A0A670JP36_PODMU